MFARRRRLIAAALLVAVAAATAPATASAATPAAMFGCQPAFSTVSVDGAWDERLMRAEDVTASPWFDAISTHAGVTATSSLVRTHLEGPDRWYHRALMVKGGALTHVMTSYPNSDASTRTTTTRQIGSRWGSVTRLVDASDRGTAVTKNGYLFALNPTSGTLSRYRVVEGRNLGDLAVTSAGSAPGYQNFRGLTLMHRYRAGHAGAADVLFASTTAGALYQITVPETATYAPRLTLVRASTWSFDQLAAVQCDGRTALLGVRTGSDQAFLYRVDSYAGTSSSIRGFGLVRGGWPAAHTAGSWYAQMGPSRW